MPSSIEIEIENLSFKAIIGVYEEERLREQEIVIDASFSYKYNNGVYVDYEKIKNLIKEFVIKKKFYLLEDAILEIKKEVATKFPQLSPLKIGITKPNILEDCKVKISG